MITVEELEDSFISEREIPAAVNIAMRTYLYGGKQDTSQKRLEYHVAARRMAQKLYQEANTGLNSKPRGHSRGADKAKPYLEMIDELVYLTKL